MTTTIIAKLNDQCRTAFGVYPNTRVVLTPGFTILPPNDQSAILEKVQRFNSFTEANDPHGEHDFGAIDHNGEKVFWKIDYYAPDMEHGSEDPSDPKQTVRLLTIMLASEY